MNNIYQRSLSQRIIDVMLDKISHEFGEKGIIKDLEDADAGKLFQKICDLEDLFKQHSWHFTDLTAKDLASMTQVITIFTKDLNDILKEANFEIDHRAVKEMLLSTEFDKKRFLAILDRILHIVYKDRPFICKHRQSYKGTKIKLLHEIDISKSRNKWRVFYTNNPNIILGFDFDHDHDRAIRRIESRYPDSG
jgi:hypothetical protein